MAVRHVREINEFLDDLFSNRELQERWDTDPVSVMDEYDLTPEQRIALERGDADALVAMGLDERHTRQMIAGW